MNEETKPPTTRDIVTEEDKGRCAPASGAAIKGSQLIIVAAALFLAAVIPPFDQRMFLASLFTLCAWQAMNLPKRRSPNAPGERPADKSTI